VRRFCLWAKRFSACWKARRGQLLDFAGVELQPLV